MQWYCCPVQANLFLFILAVRRGRVGVLMVVLADVHISLVSKLPLQG